MARSPQPRHRARHVSGSQWAVLDDLARVVRAASPRPSALAAKTTAVVAAGSLAFAVMLPGEEASASVSQRAVVDDSIPVGTAAMALLSDRGDEAASRAMARVPVALAAPAVTGAKAAPVFGKLSVTAVEKPPPPPVVAASSSSSSGSSSGSASRSGSGAGSASTQASSSGGGYDWAAANSCSCARGLTQDSMKVLAAVKASFPGMNSIGGVRADSLPDHPSGRALDFMTTNRGYGDSIANMLISRAGELNIEYIIWYQRIWFPGKGWRSMAGRGSATANHMDHVHVTVR